MVLKEPKRVRINADSDLVGLLEAVKADKEARVLEKDGEPIAAIVSIEDLDRLAGAKPSAAEIRRALNAAGAWKDTDTEALKEKIYSARHESPPSAPVRL